MKRSFFIGKIHKTRPPGVEQCVDGTFTDRYLKPGVCSYHGGLMLKRVQKEQQKKERKNAIVPDENRVPIQAKAKTLHKNVFIGPAVLPEYDNTKIHIAPEPADAEIYQDAVLPETDLNPPDNYYIVNSDNKAELHFSYETYKALPQNQKSEIKKYFLWGKQRQAWVSKGDFRTWGAQATIKMLNLPLHKKEARKTFEEAFNQKIERAENRAEGYENAARKAENRASQLQSDFNRFRKDWAWLTQPNVNTSGGRRFTSHKDKVVARYERGFDELHKSEEYLSKSEIAKNTAAANEINDLGFLARRIKETTKTIKKLENRIEDLDKKLLEIDRGKKFYDYHENEITKDRLLDIYENNLRDFNYHQSKLLFLLARKEELESQMPVIFNRETLKNAKFITTETGKNKRWHKVIRLNPLSVTASSWEMELYDREYSSKKYPYAEIKDFSESENFVMVRFGFREQPAAIGYIPYNTAPTAYPAMLQNTALATAISLQNQLGYKRIYYKVLKATGNNELALYTVYFIYNRRQFNNNIPAQVRSQINQIINQYKI